MMAKISDLGMARILNLTPLQVSRMTGTPGTPAYMPPEVMVANPKKGTSIDEFSYGIMMIHIFSGKWPEPQIGPSRIEADKLIPVTEAERREVFLEIIGKDHPLINLIHKCIKNDPRRRAHACEIVAQLAETVLQFSASFVNRLEMLQRIKSDTEEKKVLREERDAAIQKKEKQILNLKEEAKRKSEEIDRLNVIYSGEIEQMKLKVRDLTSKYQLLVAKNKADMTEYGAKIALYKSQIENTQKVLQQEKYQSEIQLSEERNLSRELAGNNQNLRSQISESTAKINSLQHTNSKLKLDISKKDETIARKSAELEASARNLQERDAIISGMKEQFVSAREHQQQVLPTNVTWKECAELPTKLNTGKAIVISGKVYCGGGVTYVNDDKYAVHCYDPSQDKWTTLPLLPVRYFGLGQVYGKLVAIGGQRKNDDIRINDVYTYDEQSQMWKQTVPPMPTARDTVDVLSLKSALVVAGGYTPVSSYTAVVEIFKPVTSQWYRTNPLPTACDDISLVSIGDTCYAVGGYNDSHLNQALCVSAVDLLCNAVPANQVTGTHIGSSDAQVAWKILPNIPTYLPAVAVLNYSLLVTMGGRGMSKGRVAYKTEVYMYSPSTYSWVYISDLPVRRSGAAVAVLSSTEFLVIGGLDGGYVNTVYKGTLAYRS